MATQMRALATILAGLLVAFPAGAQTKPAPAEKKKEPAAEEQKPAAEAPKPAAEAEEPKVEPLVAKTPAPVGIGLEFALKLGGALPLAKLGPSFSVALEAAYALPVLERRLRAGVEGRFNLPGQTGTLTDPAVQAGAAFNWTLETLAVVVSFPLSYRYDGGAWAVVGGLAPGFQLVQAKVTAFDLPNTQTDTHFDADAFAAFDYKLGPGAATAELRYNFVSWDFLATGRAHAGGLTLGVGYRYGF